MRNTEMWVLLLNVKESRGNQLNTRTDILKWRKWKMIDVVERKRFNQKGERKMENCHCLFWSLVRRNSCVSLVMSHLCV